MSTMLALRKLEDGLENKDNGNSITSSREVVFYQIHFVRKEMGEREEKERSL